MTLFKTITSNNFQQIFDLSKEIWNNNYQDMISQKQINYMLYMMYNPERLQQNLKEGYK